MAPADRSPLQALGADAARVAELSTLAAGRGRPARVVLGQRIRVVVHDGHTSHVTDPDRSRVDDPDTGEPGLPVVGDWVVVTEGATPGVIALAPRRGRLVRRDPGEIRPQVLAAGIDVVLVTVPLDRPLVAGLIERALVTAFDSGAAPVLVLTKVDAARSSGADLSIVDHELRILAPSVPAVATSAPTGEGIAAVAAYLPAGRTGVLLGPSGAGKSTLTNALVGTGARVVGDVRTGDHKGRHTTATRELVPLPSGGVLIDTPGLRALGLWDAAAGMALAFPEVAQAAESCRFADCTHRGEPECGVAAAVATGHVDPGRRDRYGALVEELSEAAEAWEVTLRNRRRRADRRAR